MNDIKYLYSEAEYIDLVEDPLEYYVGINHIVLYKNEKKILRTYHILKDRHIEFDLLRGYWLYGIYYPVKFIDLPFITGHTNSARYYNKSVVNLLCEYYTINNTIFYLSSSNNSLIVADKISGDFQHVINEFKKLVLSVNYELNYVTLF